jgi:hypothetical protein
MHDDQYIVASTVPPILHSVHATPEAAQAEAELLIAEPLRYEAMTLTQYHDAEHAFWLAQPLEEITSLDFHEALETLPPVEWETHGEVERFCLPDVRESPYYCQYASLNGRYFSRIVDILDRGTWIDATEIAAHCAREGQGHAAREDGRRIYQDVVGVSCE